MSAWRMNIWEMYPNLVRAVRASHIGYDMEATGHGFDHPLKAAQFSLLIAEDETMARLGGAAALCHNADRLIQHKLGIDKRKDVPKVLVAQMVQNWLHTEPPNTFTMAEEDDILNAVLNHGELNKPDDGPILKNVQDSDRLCCSTPENIMTGAQFFRELPAIDPEWLIGTKPGTDTYYKPGSVLQAHTHRLKWCDPSSPSTVRLPRARAIMEEFAEDIEKYVEKIKQQRVSIGLWPYPEFLKNLGR